MSDLADLLKTPGASIEADEDFDAINALYLERGWGDGLPIVPPTAERVERMLAENEEASPWEPLSVERGFPREASTVTVIGAEPPHNVNDHESLSAEGILTTIAGTMATTGRNDMFYAGANPVVVFGPEHAKTVADGGFSKADAKRFLHERATLPLWKFSKDNIERRFKVQFKERYANASEEATVPAVQRAEDIIIAVIGGAGKHSAYIPTFGATKSVTRALKRGDGTLARSVEDFRKT